MMTLVKGCLWLCILSFLFVDGGTRQDRRRNRNRNRYGDNDSDLSLWINEQQLKMLSGFSMRVYAIINGKVYTDLRDPNFKEYLPTIPSEVSYINFTWKSGPKKYKYHFDRLISMDESILKPPQVSIKKKGRVPREEKDFSIILPCTGNSSGIAVFSIGLWIQNKKNKSLPGTPLRLEFKKECAHRGVYERDSVAASQGPDPECDKKCVNNGYCNQEKICICKEGYMGQYCQTALCYPQCMNGGNCTAPAVCSCPPGYQGRQCEGGICTEKCLNGGKCVQKDVCQCSKGYFGLRCEFSKCVIPCKNGGRCIGSNKCRCRYGLGGNHCEIGRRQRSACRKPCRHGVCLSNHTCKCDEGWTGKYCNTKEKRKRYHKKISR